MKTLLLLFLSLGLLTCPAPIMQGPIIRTIAAPTYLINQNFEGTGYDNSETWTPTGSFVDPDYTGVIIAGSQSLRLGPTVSNVSTTESPAFTGQADAWLFCKLRIVAFNSITSSEHIDLRGGGVTLAGLEIGSTGHAKLYANGGVSAASSTTLSLATTYRVLIHYVSSGTCELFISTGTTKPTVDGSGDVVLTRTGSAGTATTALLYNGFYTPSDYIIDHVLVDDVEIGNNP